MDKLESHIQRPFQGTDGISMCLSLKVSCSRESGKWIKSDSSLFIFPLFKILIFIFWKVKLVNVVISYFDYLVESGFK